MQKKVTDSVINDEAYWATNKEKLDEKKPPWVDTSVIVDALVVKGRPGVGVGETLTDALSDWLDSLGTYDEDSFDGGEIIRVRVDIIMGGAGKF